MAGDKFTDIGWEFAHGVDGIIVDPYFTTPGQCYADVRTCRTIGGPEVEVHAVLHGGRTPDMRRDHLREVYAAGADSVAWWSGDNTTHWHDLLDWVCAELGEFMALDRPVLLKQHPVLVVSDGYYAPAADMYRRYGRIDVVSSQDRYAVDESKYQQIIDTTNGHGQEPWGGK